MENQSFFDRITFDPKLKNTFIAKYFKSVRSIILLTLTLAGVGFVVYQSLPRELNPNIQIPTVFIQTILPGANPEDIEKLITIPLEDSVSGLSGVNSVTSTSTEGFSSISVEFSSKTDPDKAKREVESALATVNNLPQAAERPVVQVLDFQNQPVISFFVTSEGDSSSLQNFSILLEEQLRDLSTVEKVELRYDNKPEIAVILSPEKITSLGLNISLISDAVRSALETTPAGSVTSTQNNFSVSQARAFYSLDDIRDLPLSINGATLLLGDIATIEEKSEINARQALALFPNTESVPNRAILFSVYKTDSADASVSTASIRETFESLNKTYRNQFHFEAVSDSAKEIKKSFDQLFKDFLITIGLVFIILILFFGLKQSLVASFAIPLTFLCTFIVMGITGISINFIALFSLLLALGILVDNVIVIISAITSYERTKKFTPEESALLVWRDFHTVIFTTTLTTVWAFLPLLLATGIIGEFIKPIPIVVSTALAISAFIALFIVLPLMAVLQAGKFPKRTITAFYLFLFAVGFTLLFFLIPTSPWKWPLFIISIFSLLGLVFSAYHIRQKRSLLRDSSTTQSFKKTLHRIAEDGVFDFEPFSHRYERFIRKILSSRSTRRQLMAGLIIFAVFSYLLVPAGLVVSEFFPEDDLETVFVSVTLPLGTPLEKTFTEAEQFLLRFKDMPDTHYAFLESGAAVSEGVSVAKDSHTFLITLGLVPKGDRDRTSGEIVTALSHEFQDYTTGKVAVSQASSGPPAGSDLQIKLLGNDLATLQIQSQEIENYLAKQAGVSDITRSIESGASRISFSPNQAELARLGMGANDVATWLRLVGQGYTLKEDVFFGTQKRDVSIRLTNESGFTSTDTLSSLLVETKEGLRPISTLGEFKLSANPTLITREDGKRSISVSARVADGYTISTLNNDLEAFADTLDLPIGYSWKTGGVNDENQKSITSILQAMLLSALLIFATMTVQFNSFRKALIVLLVIPLAVSGVFIVFALTGTPLSFPALIGILALFGIVVNNSIIMVDKINRNMDSGMELHNAISEGAASRLEPILLTALSTIIGLIPITLSDPIWQGLGGAIIAGLLFSGIAKLLFIPLMYTAFFESEKN